MLVLYEPLQRNFRPILYTALVAFELLFSFAIIHFIRYTEIDWVTYMHQIGLIKQGITDYTQISGPTGPLVYPGGHVVIFSWLYDHFPEVHDAQYVFLALYLVTFTGVLAVYHNAKIPWYYCVLLVLSKRIHSIYLLRLFNDCWAVLFTVYGVLCIQLDLHAMASVLLSLAISVKMSALLFIPGVLIVWWNLLGFGAGILGVIAAVPQFCVARPFLSHWKEYIAGAFDIKRQFMYKWTVNWRFIPQPLFNSKKFANSLLATNVSLLTVLVSKSLGKPMTTANRTRVIMLANLIGVACARSLHYQFYSWFFWTVPFLLVKVPLPLQIVLFPALEWAWLTFPSTNLSSSVHLACMIVLILFNLNQVCDPVRVVVGQPAAVKSDVDR